MTWLLIGASSLLLLSLVVTLLWRRRRARLEYQRRQAELTLEAKRLEEHGRCIEHELLLGRFPHVHEVIELLQEVREMEVRLRRETDLRGRHLPHLTEEERRQLERMLQDLHDRLHPVLEGSRAYYFSGVPSCGSELESAADGGRKSPARGTIDELARLESEVGLARKARWGEFEVAALKVLRDTTSVAPHPITDDVHFSVTGPGTVSPGMRFVLDVWAHFEHQRPDIVRRAREGVRGEEPLIRSKGPVHVARGTVLSVNLVLEGLDVVDAVDTILWTGGIGNATFCVGVPDGAKAGPRRGLLAFHVGGIRVAKLHFILQVGGKAGENEVLRGHEERYRKAFASYASADRDEVLSIIQGIQKGLPSIEVTMDVAKLRSGDYWSEKILEMIPSHDVFYLFWSEAASKSEYVEREWRCALRSRGIDFIDPVPLASPDVVPPPEELASRHFNDWVLAYKSRDRFGRAGQPDAS